MAPKAFHNKYILKEDIFDAFNNEVDRMLPSFEYCLAAKKEKKPEGSSALRGRASPDEGIRPSVKSGEMEECDEESIRTAPVGATLVYPHDDGMAIERWSEPRGRLIPPRSPVLQVCGEYAARRQKEKEVSLEEFQAAVADRHSIRKPESIIRANNRDFD